MGMLGSIFGSILEAVADNSVSNYDSQNRAVGRAMESERYQRDSEYRARVDQKREDLQRYHDSLYTNGGMDKIENLISQLKGED